MDPLANVNHLFIKNVNVQPGSYCLSSQKSDYTYKEADRKSTNLSNLLTSHLPLQSRNVIAVLVDDLENLSLIALSLLKIDATFLFIDSRISKNAVRDIIDDNDVSLIITEKNLTFYFDKSNIQILIIEDSFNLLSGNHTISKEKNSSICFKIFMSDNENKYVEDIVHSDILNKTLEVLDTIIPAFESDKIIFASRIPLNEFIIEALHALTRGKHIILAPVDPMKCFQSDENFSMDFSLFYFGSYTKEMDAHNKYNLLLESVKHGDQNGYSAVWTPERHFNEFGGLFPNPSVLGAALSMVTSNVQVRAGSIVSPIHHSVRIAEDWSIIDNLSNGRAALSFASGWQCDDFVFYPERYEKRHQQMLDQIKDVQTLWKGGTLELKNGLGKNINVELFPKPLQSQLPVWITVSGKTETFIDAGKIGANILTHLLWQDSSELKEKIAAYRISLKQNGFDPDSRIVSVMLHTFVGENDGEVKKIVKEPLKEYIKSSVHLIEAMTRSNGAVSRKDTVGRYGNVNDKIPSHLLEELVEIAFNRFFEEAALLGSPKKCHALLKRLRDFGVNELACLIDFGLDKQTILTGLENLTKLKANYDFKIIKKYRPVLLRSSTDAFEKMMQDKNFEKPLQSLRKIILTGSSDHPDIPYRYTNLKYDFSNDNSFVEQVSEPDNEKKSVKDLFQVNSIINEDF